MEIETAVTNQDMEKDKDKEIDEDEDEFLCFLPHALYSGWRIGRGRPTVEMKDWGSGSNRGKGRQATGGR